MLLGNRETMSTPTPTPAPAPTHAIFEAETGGVTSCGEAISTPAPAPTAPPITHDEEEGA